MKNKLNELEAKKAELDGQYNMESERAKMLQRDIVLMEQLLAARQEFTKTVNYLGQVDAERRKVCAEIEAEKAKDKLEEAEKKE